MKLFREPLTDIKEKLGGKALGRLCVLAVQTNGPFGGDSDAGIQSDTLLSTVNFNVSKASVVSHIQVDVRDHGDKKSNVHDSRKFPNRERSIHARDWRSQNLIGLQKDGKNQ
jgi:hypothetical protein